MENVQSNKGFDSLLNSDYSYPVPSQYYIDPASVCNLKCPFCLTGNGRGTIKKGVMSIENYRIILNKIVPFAKIIEFCNWGEPFLNKNIIDIVSLTSEKGIFTSIHSNLTARAFDEHECKSIIQSGLDRLSCSIDGTNQETYSIYRRGGDFDTAIKNLKQLQITKIKLKSKTPDILWQFLIHKYNEHEVDKAIQMAISFGVRITYNIMGVKDDEWRSTYHEDKNKFKLLKMPFIEKIRYLIHEIQLQRRGKTWQQRPDKIKLPENLPDWCTQPFHVMTINWDGDVFPCCAVHDNKAVMGNLLETEINELWNNNEFKKCRDYLLAQEKKSSANSVCERCCNGQLIGVW